MTRGSIQLICLGVIGIVAITILFTGWHSVFATVPMGIGGAAARVKAFLITLVVSVLFISTAHTRKEEEEMPPCEINAVSAHSFHAATIHVWLVDEKRFVPVLVDLGAAVSVFSAGSLKESIKLSL